MAWFCLAWFGTAWHRNTVWHGMAPHRYALNLMGDTPTQRLRADRHDAPGISVDIAGPNATVSVVAWVKRDKKQDGRLRNNSYGFLAGVWGDSPTLKARQYAMYFDLGACNMEAGHGTRAGTPVYNHGLAAHVSNCGGATPG